MRVVRYKITLKEPVLVTTMSGGDPNSAVAFDYLPGSVLRGYVIGRVANRDGELSEDDYELFFGGKVRFLNGYPLYDTQRALPTPMSWRKPKNENYIQDQINGSLPEDKQPERVKKPFWAWDDPNTKDAVYLWEPQRYLDVHNARNRRYGRAVPTSLVGEGEDSGAVYRYDALASGQVFEAAIICDDTTDANYIVDLLGQKSRGKLGGARSASYGRVSIHSIELLDDANWSEATSKTSSDEFVVTLLSDALVRDKFGQYVADGEAVARAIERQLNSQLKLIEAYDSPTMIGGFNRTWGLPLPQTIAVEMGSVYRFSGYVPNPSDVVLLTTQGIGERRVDGFGRIAINWHHEWNNIDELKITDEKVEPKVDPPEQITLTSGTTEHTLATQMAKRILRQRLDEWVREQALLTQQLTEQAEFRQHVPSASQISQLRMVVQFGIDNKLKVSVSLKKFVDSVESRQVARRDFERCRLTLPNNSPQTLLDWLKKIQDEPISLHNEADKVSIAKVKVSGDDLQLLQHEYTLRFVDAVCAYMMKPKRED